MQDTPEVAAARQAYADTLVVLRDATAAAERAERALVSAIEAQEGVPPEQRTYA